MGLQFDFLNTGATIKHLNFRKTGPDDDKILAIDMKLGGEVMTGLWLAELFTPDADDFSAGSVIDSFFWQVSDVIGGDGAIEFNPRFHGVTDPIKFNREYHACQVTFGGLDLIGTASKFAFLPGAKRICDVTFSLSITDPEVRTVSILSEMLAEDAQCSVYASDLLDEQHSETRSETQHGLDLHGDAEPGDDPIYQEALMAVVREGRCSISFIQRELKIGYNRAARIVEKMEAEKVVSPIDSTGARTVLLSVEVV